MNGSIAWYKSRTIWFGLAQAVIGLVVFSGYLSDSQGSQLLEYVGLAMTALGVAGVQGRVTSTKEIKSEILPPANPNIPAGTA